MLLNIWTAALLGLAAAIPVAEPIPEAFPEAFPDGDGSIRPSGHEVEILGVSYSGSGCKPNSAVTNIADDKTTMTISYSDFIAYSGPGVSPKENRKNCNLNVKLKYPGGWQYSVFTTEFRGYADISKGSRGQCKATYWFTGQSEQGSKELTKYGPFQDNYKLSDSKPLDTVVWSPCGKQGLLNINSEVRVVPLGTGKPNYMSVDTTDARFVQIVYFQWRKCPLGH